ncbi:MAG: 2-hydroxyacid dehydrogenase [Marinibacterium sp.]
MAKPAVLVTRAWPAAVETRLSERYETTFNPADRPLGPDDLQKALGQFDAILTTVTDRIGADTLKAGSRRCRILANYGVGYSHIDEAAARAAGLVVTNTPDVLSDCTADLAMGLILASARRMGEGEREVRAGTWTGWRPTHMMGTKVTGKTLGIIGFGRIGQEVARRAHFGFGMKILVQSRSPVPADVLARFGAVQVDTVEDLLPHSDFVSLHCPGGAANRHLIDAGRLALMQRTAHLINTARGEVVDEAALATALLSGTIAGAGLDVFEAEPVVNVDLLRCENAVLLPHLGSATRETREGMGFRVLDNLDDFFAGKDPRDRVI